MIYSLYFYEVYVGVGNNFGELAPILQLKRKLPVHDVIASGGKSNVFDPSNGEFCGMLSNGILGVGVNAPPENEASADFNLPAHVGFVLDSSRSSWPKKLKFGEIFDFLCLMNSYASSSDSLSTLIRYAKQIVTDRDIPALQWTKTLPF